METQVKDLVQEFEQEVDQVVGKSKRKLSESQLLALAEGRRKRWEKKIKTSSTTPIKEEKVSEVESELSSEEKKSEPESVSSESESEEDGDPSSYCNSNASTSDKYDDSDVSDNNSTISEADENEEPPPLPVLKRTKVVSKNEKAVAKMNKYIAKKVAQSQYPGHLFL